MIFEVAVGDRLCTVGIVRKGGLLHVDLDGRTHIVDARRISDSVLSMLVQPDGGSVPSRSVDAAFAHSIRSAHRSVLFCRKTFLLMLRAVAALDTLSRSSKYCQYTPPQAGLDVVAVCKLTVMFPIAGRTESPGMLVLKYPVPAWAFTGEETVLLPNTMFTGTSSLIHSSPCNSKA